MSDAPKPFAYLWKHLPTGKTGVYFEDPSPYGIDMHHKDYEWTLVVLLDALLTNKVPTETSPLSDFREGQWWVRELDDLANNPIGEEVFVTADLVRAVATVHHLLAAVRAYEASKNAS